MMWFRPFTLVILYFAIVFGHGFIANDMTVAQWATMTTYHEALGVLAGFSFAFKNEPEDKTAMLVLVAYILGLAILDPLFETTTFMSVSAIMFGALAVGGVFHFRRVASNMYRDKKTG